jgi:HK97 family phage portal protein
MVSQIAWENISSDTIKAKSSGLSVFNFSGEKLPNTNNYPYYNWFFYSDFGKPRGENLIELREYAKSGFVNMVHNAIIKQVQDTEWIVRAVNPEEQEKYTFYIDLVTNLLKHPNRNGDTFESLWGYYLKDILEIDAGVMYKARNAKGFISELFVYDATRWTIGIDEHGLINKYFQYTFTKGSQPLSFESEDIIYGKIHGSPETFPYGWSPLQSIRQTVEVLIQSTRYNKEFFARNAIPDGLIYLDMDDDALKEYKNQWMSEMQGKPHKLGFVNYPVDIKTFNSSNRDMEWLQGQRWYHNIVFASYGLSPQEVGFYDQSSRATGESQERITVKNAIRPYLKHIESKINREIISEFFPKGETIPIEFKFMPKDHVQEKIEHDQTMAKIDRNIYTINEVRAIEGKNPVSWGDMPLTIAFRQPNQQLNQTDEQNSNQNSSRNRDDNRDNDLKDRDEDMDKFLDFDLIEDAQDYADFLKKNFDKWEEKIIKAVDSNLDSEVPKENKGFNEFIRRVFNIVNTIPFRKKLEFYVGRLMKEGLKEAENEINLDIPPTEEFKQRIKILSDQQLEGYHIEDEHWNGIKGVTHNLQVEIIKSVQEGISARKSLNKIKEDISEIMRKEKGGSVEGKITEGRTMRIARTETTRIKNTGRLQAFGDSGVKGRKMWVVSDDCKNCEFCKSLNGQKKEINESFVDFTGVEKIQPPRHPNCACMVKYIVEE